MTWNAIVHNIHLEWKVTINQQLNRYNIFRNKTHQMHIKKDNDMFVIQFIL